MPPEKALYRVREDVKGLTGDDRDDQFAEMFQPSMKRQKDCEI